MARAPTGGGVPAFPRELTQCGGDVAVDHHAYVVKRRIKLAVGVAPSGIIQPMLGSVPAVAGQVETADERQGVVHDDELLVMRCAGRMTIVELKIEPPLGSRREPELGKPFALQREQQGEIPAQDIGVEFGARGEQRGKKITQPFRQSVVRAGRDQSHPAVDIPTEDENGALRLCECRSHRAEIFGAVDKPACAVRALDPPAVATRHQQIGALLARTRARFVDSQGCVHRLRLCMRCSMDRIRHKRIDLP